MPGTSPHACAQVALVNTIGLDLGTTLVCSGLYNIYSGAAFGVPMPVQPMKSIAAVAITEDGITLEQTLLAGFLVSAVVFTLGITKLIDVANRMVHESVIRGIQVGIGLKLAIKGADLVMFTGPGGPWRPWLGAQGLLLGCTAAVYVLFAVVKFQPVRGAGGACCGDSISGGEAAPSSVAGPQVHGSHRTAAGACSASTHSLTAAEPISMREVAPVHVVAIGDPAGAEARPPPQSCDCDVTATSTAGRCSGDASTGGSGSDPEGSVRAGLLSSGGFDAARASAAHAVASGDHPCCACCDCPHSVRPGAVPTRCLHSQCKVCMQFHTGCCDACMPVGRSCSQRASDRADKGCREDAESIL